jgi:hypothetical protein
VRFVTHLIIQPRDFWLTLPVVFKYVTFVYRPAQYTDVFGWTTMSKWVYIALFTLLKKLMAVGHVLWVRMVFSETRVYWGKETAPRVRLVSR